MNTPDNMPMPDLLLQDLARMADLIRASVQREGNEPLTAVFKLVQGLTPSCRQEISGKYDGWYTMSLPDGPRAGRRDLATGMLEADSFFIRADAELARAKRENRPFTLMLFEVAARSQGNDKEAAVMRALMSRLWDAAGESDLLGRLDDQVVALALPDSGHFQALALAEAAVEAACLTLETLGLAPRTLRAGVAALPSPGDADRAAATMPAILDRARQALAQASDDPTATVRDRVRLFREKPPVERETLVLADEKQFLFFGGSQ